MESKVPMPAPLLSPPAELTSLAASTLYLLPRGTDLSAAHPIGEYIDLSKTHLPTLVEPPPCDPGWGRVCLQHEHSRWQAAKRRLNVAEDHQLATVLLDLYENSIASAQQLIKTEAVHSQTEALYNVAQVVREVTDGVRDVAGEVTGAPGLHCEIGLPVPLKSGQTPAARSIAQRRRRPPPANRSRPCPKSKKAGSRYRELKYTDDADGSPPEDGVEETSAKLFTFPPVEPELLHYFSCGLCDDTGFGTVEAHFDHLWQRHTEFHMVGGRIRRIPIRLRPQLFVVCALCGLNNKGSTGFSDSYLTTTHLPDHSPVLAAAGDAPLRCDACCAEFDERAALALHALDADHENAAHRCTACGLQLEGRLNYIAHLQRHYLSRLFQCYFCMTPFASETACIAHIKRHHADDYSVHKCSCCGYVTALFHDFLLHIRSHSQLNRHVCHVCGVMFVSKMSLKHHIPTHTDSQFPCDVCGKIFSHPQTRRRHEINVHHNPEKCTCSVCGRQFGSAYSMKRHYMIHTGERPYQCDKCGRGFVQKGDLHGHYKRCKFTELAGVFVTI